MHVHTPPVLSCWGMHCCVFRCPALLYRGPKISKNIFLTTRVLYHRSQAFAFGKGDDMALEYLKELRQNGTDRRSEMSMLISGGFLEYRAIKDAEEAEVCTIITVEVPFALSYNAGCQLVSCGVGYVIRLPACWCIPSSDVLWSNALSMFGH